MGLALPGMDGWEATRRVKAHPLLQQTVVIAVTAHGLPNHRESAMHAGCEAVIIKPYDLVALAEQVRRVVAQRGVESAAHAHEP
jgi:two-component system, cell cycle response regulator DivK